MAERGTREWSELLIEVTMAMNSELHDTLRLTSYKIVFNQHMRIDNQVPVEEREHESLHIAQDEQFRMQEEVEEELENTSGIDERLTPPFLRTPSRQQIYDALFFTSTESAVSEPIS